MIISINHLIYATIFSYHFSQILGILHIGWGIQISLPARFTAFNLDDIKKIPILWPINSDFLSGKNGKRKYCNKAKERKANLSLAMAKMYYTTNTQITESELYGRSISLPETFFSVQGNRRLRPGAFLRLSRIGKSEKL